MGKHQGKLSDCIDLHMHSLHSDGEYPVCDLIRSASECGLSAIAITDHDTIEAYAEGLELAGEFGIEFVPGVEISASDGGREIHILGYLFDPTHLEFNQILLELQGKRKTRIRGIVEKLNRMGVEIRLERVLEKASGVSVGRPHVAEVLVEEEYASHFQDAFQRYLNPEFVREFDTGKLTPREAISVITKAGGVSVLAHPAKTSRDDLIPALVEAGLAGIETYCLGMDRKTAKKYRALAKRYSLVCCGGADFHSDRGDARFGLGSVRVPYSSLESLRQARAA